MNQTNNSELLSRAAPLATVALAPNPAPPLPASISALRRLAIPLGGVLLASALIGLTVTRWDSWRSRASVQVTNNAVVRAELTRLSSRVGGNVKRVAVKDFQRVRSGDLLMEIDPADYEAVVGQAEATVAATQATLGNLENEKTHQRGLVAEAEARRLSALARMTETQQEQERQDALLTRRARRHPAACGAGDRRSHHRPRRCGGGEATIEAQRGLLDVLNGQQALLSANVRAAQAALAAAQLRLSYRRIVAPFDGVVGERQVQEGDYVNIGTNLITVVPLPNVYLTANYKEGMGLVLIYAGLDQGNRLDWFESGTVIGLLGGGATLVVGFLVNEALVAEPWASPAVLMSRNVILVLLTLIAYMVTSLSNTMLITNFLTSVGQLRPEQIGDILLTHVAFPLVVVMLGASYLLRRIDARIVALLGLTSFAAVGWMGARIASEGAPDDFIPVALVQSVGQGLTFTGLLVFAMSSSNPARATAFAAYIQVMRLDVIELAATGMTTWLRIREQVHSNLIGLHVAVGDSEVVQTLTRLVRRFADHGASHEEALARATVILASLVRREANVLSAIDGFAVAFWAAVAGIVLISLMRAAPTGPLTRAS